MRILKPIGAQTAIGTANSVANSTVVIITNIDAAAQTLTRAYSNGVTISTMLVLANTQYLIEKEPTDTLAATNCVATAIAY